MKLLAKLLILAAAMFASPALAQQTALPSAYICNACTGSLSVTATSSSVALPSTSPPYGTLTVYNGGAKTAYFVQGGSSVVATTSGIAIAAGSYAELSVNGTYIAAITGGSDTTTLTFYQSNGLIAFGTGSGGSGGGGGAITGNVGIINGATQAAVKAASTAPVGTDPALVVAISPNGVNANGQATMAASAPVAIASDQSAIAVKPQGQTTGGDSTYDGPSAAVVTNTAVSVKSSAGQIYAWALGSTGNAAACYLQVFDLATGSVTLGTTAPKMSIGIPTGGGSNLQFPNGIAFATAITVAATTTRTGSTACTVGIDTNIVFK